MSEPLKEFAIWIIENGPFLGSDLQGWDIQDKAIELGLLKSVPYDPEIHGPNDLDMEPGDSWLEYTELLK